MDDDVEFGVLALDISGGIDADGVEIEVKLDGFRCHLSIDKDEFKADDGTKLSLFIHALPDSFHAGLGRLSDRITEVSDEQTGT